ncbi:Fumarylacetoacetate hydrolase family protein [Caenispirillum salinarum AK4]|uniref:Fumarylacetoacetate hydrolase family protein n=1 Tax=Caenispirillum salinarum AK4 TaxID=1238182 RepID=K9H3N3_9PROT|nr:fumarylacetoacetate hydrolase family protein [Caenispirillum salinarum]EKV32137.1 Fumarylacetoacetate hydrolase family protein [Caenispirillum salinarum AK4]
MAFVVPAPRIPAVPVEGTDDTFPVRRVFCVGRNYAAHAREMGANPDAEPPFFFMKPADALVPGGGDVPYPPATADLHHEVEMVVALRDGGADIAQEAALDAVFGYAVGIDLTRRDLQAAAKKAGKPWDMAKGFDASAPISAIRPADRCGHPASGAVSLSVDGQVRQNGDLADMIWSVPAMIAYLSTLVILKPGDLIFTGTPEGVGAVARGARMDASVDGIGALTVTLV